MRAAAVLVLCAASCDPAGGGRRPEAPPPCGDGADAVPPDGFCAAYLRTYCEAEARCARFAPRPSPFEDCPGYAAALAPACEADLVALAASGGTTYEDVEAGRCLACLAALPCSELAALDGDRPSCLRRVFAGAGHDGEPCRDDVSCRRGLGCDLSAGCPGVCGPAAGEPRDLRRGEACGDGAGRCAAGLYCRAGTCAEPQGEGERCGPEGGECRAHALWCRPAAPPDPAGTCARPPGPGEECGEAAGLAPFCAGSVCDPLTGFCVQPRDLGQRCTADDQCRTWACGEGGVCGPWRAPADPCPP